MRFIKYILLLFLFFCFLLPATVAEAQTDSIPSTDSVIVFEVNEEALQDFMIQTSQPFACRVFSTLITHRDGYSSSMGRKDNVARLTQITGGVQFITRVNSRTTLGLTVTGRRLMLHDHLAPLTDIFKSDSSQNSETYLRYLIFQSRYNLKLKRNQLFISSNAFIPLTGGAEVVYNKTKNQDIFYKQLNVQAVFSRIYSSNFSFNRGITAIYRITGKPVSKLAMRGFLLPVFQHRLSTRIYFTASAELNALLVNSFFNNLYINERAGVSYNGPFSILYSFQYGYYALGKNTNAQHSFNVSLKREFKTFPVRKLRNS